MTTHCLAVQTSPLHHLHPLLRHSPACAVPAQRQADTYRKSSSFHSVSAAAPALPAVNGLVRFCCGGLSSSATQHISPTAATEGQGTRVRSSTRGSGLQPAFAIQTHPKHALAPISLPVRLLLQISNLFTLTSLPLAAQVQHLKIPEQQLRTQRGCCYSGWGLSSQLIAWYLRNDERDTYAFTVHSESDSSKTHDIHPCIY